MDKRYQVFVSSTFTDLKEERQQIIQTLMELDCIPAGMELFPALDEEQWEFIKKVIDDCDYYLVIIGGRYGSVTADGISYTEKEFDYAVASGKKVVAFLHSNPNEIPLGKSEKNSELSERLQKFREKVQTDRLVRYWTAAESLAGLVSLAMTKTIKTFPAIGWVRANQIANESILSEIHELRKKNEALQSEVMNLRSELRPVTDGVALLSSNFDFNISYMENIVQAKKKTVSITWRELFGLIGPYLFECRLDSDVREKLSQLIMDRERIHTFQFLIDEQVFETVTIQFIAYGFIDLQKISNGSGYLWVLSKLGYKNVVECRMVRDKAAIELSSEVEK